MLRFFEFVEIRNIGGVYNDCAQMLQHFDAMLEDLDEARICASHIAGDANTRTVESLEVKEFCVVGKTALLAQPGSSIPSIDASHCSKQDRCVGNGARHRTGCILTMGNRNDPTATQQAQSWFYAYDAIRLCGADDRAIRFSANRGRA